MSKEEAGTDAVSGNQLPSYGDKGKGASLNLVQTLFTHLLKRVSIAIFVLDIQYLW